MAQAGKLFVASPWAVVHEADVAQEQVGAAWLDKDAWTKMSILNTARSGKFSSDRAIAEYCDEIWNVWPLTVTM